MDSLWYNFEAFNLEQQTTYSHTHTHTHQCTLNKVSLVTDSYTLWSCFVVSICMCVWVSEWVSEWCVCIHVDRGCTCKVSQQDITLSTLSVLLISSQQCSGSTSQSDSTVKYVPPQVCDWLHECTFHFIEHTIAICYSITLLLKIFLMWLHVFIIVLMWN